jgi:hypothetical protein
MSLTNKVKNSLNWLIGGAQGSGVDSARAAELQHYTVSPGSVVSAKADGNIVELKVTGRPTRVTASNLSDDPARRFFKNHPAVMMPAPVSLPVNWP